MLRHLRSGRLPAAVRAELDLEPGELVLSHAEDEGGGYVVATDRALHLPGGRRVGWEHVEHAEWERTGLHVREIVPLGERPRTHHLHIREPGRLPDIVQDRVTSSIAVNQYVRLEGDDGVRIVGRRTPGGDEVVWNLIFDAGLDPHDPEVRAWAERFLVEVQRQTGL